MRSNLLRVVLIPVSKLASYTLECYWLEQSFFWLYFLSLLPLFSFICCQQRDALRELKFSYAQVDRHFGINATQLPTVWLAAQGCYASLWHHRASCFKQRLGAGKDFFFPQITHHHTFFSCLNLESCCQVDPPTSHATEAKSLHLDPYIFQTDVNNACSSSLLLKVLTQILT